MKKWYIFKGIKIALFVATGIFLMGYIVMRLWNWLVPDLFHGPVIEYCQAFGLLILSKILFGGFKGRGWGGHCGCGHGGWRGRRMEDWKQKFEEKMSHLSPEERERMKKKMADRCSGWNWDKPAEQKTDDKA